jgi:UDP-N-acetylglucosamine--N-acetylmuramyl-(pentapeptide) pyrophosphoryl-undecaprenol N-acetylglucosamine transferase
MRGPAVKLIVVAAGGTGGHFFPAEALAAEFLARGHRIALMTDARSAGLRSSVFAGHEQIVLPGAGLAGRGAKAISGAAGLARGVLRARAVLRRLAPAALVGFGGYPSVPPVLAARSLGRLRPRIVLHEQNAVLGRANRFLARRADLLALSFANTQRLPARVPTRVVGDPVRAAFQPVEYAAPEGDIRLLVLGGSLGARVFSDIVPPAVALLPEPLRRRVRVVQQCRAEDVARVRAAYQAQGTKAELATFFHDVPQRLAASHLVIARAGASTVAELAIVSRPAILVPLPHAIDDHQTANASALADAGAAWLMPQAGFTPPALAELLGRTLADPAGLAAASAAAARQAHAEAAAALADLVEQAMAEPVR